MGCGMQNLCRRRNSEEDEETSSLGYSVAVSNSMFREERWVQAGMESIPTVSCNLGFSSIIDTLFASVCTSDIA